MSDPSPPTYRLTRSSRPSGGLYVPRTENRPAASWPFPSTLPFAKRRSTVISCRPGYALWSQNPRHGPLGHRGSCSGTAWTSPLLVPDPFISPPPSLTLSMLPSDACGRRGHTAPDPPADTTALLYFQVRG